MIKQRSLCKEAPAGSTNNSLSVNKKNASVKAGVMLIMRKVASHISHTPPRDNTETDYPSALCSSSSESCRIS
ncbi:hypothetical protein FEG98_15285 [Escherichia coli]|uniref:Uncharacterized protein n=1 Tax=Salmonella enterica subsp. enterica serovar Typhi str. CT18 TaxID=220341 RepID=A0A716XBX1_SALTI|nr:hypothetical protein [Escherichia coli]HAD5564186.1 hypothetical protein [Salmonella enterica subsp. enterica serovar Typhi str. CT18]HAH3767056.1 hypothetical protein [Escherichia coli]HAJ5611674.1 hypothetical protein [Escherichia coli]